MGPVRARELTERAGAGGRLAPYRAVLSVPGIRPLTAVAFLARIPASGAAIVLTLHVVLGLGHGYAAAGLVGAAATVGLAVGAPVLGRLVDRRGLRTMLAVSATAEAVFWSVAPWLPYPALLTGALVGGVLGLPVFTVVRQAISAMVPPGRRRPAFAVDSMSVELSYIVGPAAGAALAVGVSTTAAMLAVGAGFLVACAALWALNPPTRTGGPARTGARARVPVRTWLTRRLAAVLLASTAATTVLFGSELGVIAALEGGGQAGLLGLVVAVWCLSSLAGGFVYGMARNSWSLFALVAGLGVATVPVALGGQWWTFALLLVPAGLLCAPALAASADAVAGLAPDAARGLVTGLHGSALTLGAAVGAPLAGLLIDAASPGTAIVAVALTGSAAAGLAAVLARSAPRPVASSGPS
jgi:MFS family permease